MSARCAEHRRLPGAILAGLLALAAPAIAAAANWQRAESPHFVVYADNGERAARDYALMLEDFDATLRTLHGRPVGETVPRKLDVYVVGDRKELKRIKPDIGENVAAIYLTNRSDIFAAAVRNAAGGPGDLNRGDDLVLANYALHFLTQYYSSAYPAWLMKGYAEYYMTADIGASKITVGGLNRGRSNWLLRPDWLPMDQVLTRRQSEVPEADRSKYSAQAWVLTHYVLSDHDRATKLPTYLAAVRKGVDAVSAWKSTFGDDPRQLEAKLRRYTDRPLSGLVLTKSWTAPAVTVTALTPGMSAVLLDDQQMNCECVADRPGMLANLRAAARTYPADRFVRRTLARAETRFGDRDAGEAILKALIAEDPKDADALQTLALSELARGRTDLSGRKADFAEAGRLFAQAAKIEPDSYQTLFGYAESRSIDPAYPTKNDLEVLLKATTIAPQLPGLRIEAARAAIRLSEPDTARQLLTSVADNPQGGPVALQAQRILNTLATAGPAAAAAQAGTP